MLRITELKLPLNHEENQIKLAICSLLDIIEEDLIDFSIFRQGVDARKKNDIYLVYTIDVLIKNEQAIWARLSNNLSISKTPDITYQFVAQAPATLTTRPIVIGTGPCGLFAGLILAQMGFKPLILERGKSVRERT